ncbi:hypothetical protein JL100_015755 [Skermanella mucosa]|uniref:hypothetical protein n=1 Tax=Skermanella mucosa TaxID=1789672 RepID=UPI00192A94AA|nr:hypothetical protein [Skermanella mucosa]UEM18572.1 hypothetical protein JL100_015755 [Skermanella mucosa]
MTKRFTGGSLRRLSRPALAAVLALPLLAACGEDEAAEQETTAPAVSTDEERESPAGVPSTLESTERAIEAVPPKSDGQ